MLGLPCSILCVEESGLGGGVGGVGGWGGPPGPVDTPSASAIRVLAVWAHAGGKAASVRDALSN